MYGDLRSRFPKSVQEYSHILTVLLLGVTKCLTIFYGAMSEHSTLHMNLLLLHLDRKGVRVLKAGTSFVAG